MSVESTDPDGWESRDLTPEMPILDVFDAVHRANETPVQAAAREMVEGHPELDEERRQEEADKVLGDIDDYVRDTDPADLAEAESQLADWQLPEDPLETVPDFIPEGELTLNPGPVVSVFYFTSAVEANIIKGILNGEGIACILDNVSTNPPSAYFGTAGAGGHILVGEKFAAQAKMAIETAQQAGSEPETGA